MGACTNFFEVPIETPISPKMDVSAFRRVLVAGFISGGTEDVDANLETVRLLRSQLRIEVRPARDRGGSSAARGDGGRQGEGRRRQPPNSRSRPRQRLPTAAVAPVPPLPAPRRRRQLRPRQPGRQPDARGRQDPQREGPREVPVIFADVAFWKKIGEEYENPLIVTGTVLFTPQQTSGFVTRNVETYDQLGRRSVVPQRTYMERKGFILTPKFIFIDGRTGATLHTETMHEEILYNSQQNTPALSSYFELMDKVIPSFLGTLSTQKIRGTRVLLR